MKMNFEITEEISGADEEVIRQGLLEYNLARLEDKNPKDLGIYLRDETDHICAGLTGHTHGNWLFVKYLWVSESLRGQEIGSRILMEAYRKKGFREVFTLENFPKTGKRHYFVKEL